jgi:hypothetical protein
MIELKTSQKIPHFIENASLHKHKYNCLTFYIGKTNINLKIKLKKHFLK